MIIPPAARLARPGGAGEFPALDGDSNPVATDDGVYCLEIDRGSTNVDTGFVMRFVNADLHNLSAFDVCSVPELSAMQSPSRLSTVLIPRQWGILEFQGYILIQAAYDRGSQMFEDAKRGWQLPVGEPLDRLIQLTKQMDGRTAPVISYLIAEEGPER